MTDRELRDAAVAKLKLTTVGYKNKHWRVPPPGTNWDLALDYLAQIGQAPPASTFRSPASRIVLDPGEIAAWVVHDSPTRQTLGAERDKHAIIRWDTQGIYSARKTCAIFAFRILAGFPGRFYDFHTSPAAVGGWTPPGNPDGVASLAIDYRDNGKGIQVVTQPDWPNHETTIIPASEVTRSWEILFAEITWGRPGRVKVWRAGESTPRVDRAANTHYDTQNLVTFWEGAYESTKADVRSEIEIAATHFGRTWSECFNDQPRVFVREGAGSPPGSASALADVSLDVPAPPS